MRQLALHLALDSYTWAMAEELGQEKLQIGCRTLSGVLAAVMATHAADKLAISCLRVTL
jgi:hypothetical protein